MKNISVFKYRSDFDRDIGLLSKGRIFIPCVEQLNDPYEGLFEPVLLEQLKNTNRNTDKVIESVNDVFSKKDALGIYSLSQEYDNELLWAHYANSHKGFCIEFDLFSLYYLYRTGNKKLNFSNLIIVDYLAEPPVITLNDIEHLDFNDFTTKIIGTKSSNWSYENEVRILHEKTGEVVIDYRAIKSITFGIRSDPKQIELFIKTFPYKIPVYKSRLTNRYKIERDFITFTEIEVNIVKASTEYLIVNNDDENYEQYKNQIEKAIEIVQLEPFVIDVFYAGLYKLKNEKSQFIQIHANRNKEILGWPVKTYFFEIYGNEVIYRPEIEE